MKLEEPSRLKYIVVGAVALTILPIWEAWPLTSLSGLQVWAFVGRLIGSAIVGAVGGWLWWKFPILKSN